MISSSREYTKKDFISDYGYESYTDAEIEEDNPGKIELFENAKKFNWKIYEGSADSYEQSTLCELTLNYEDDDIKIEKEGGY